MHLHTFNTRSSRASGPCQMQTHFIFFFLLGLCYILNYSFIAIFAVVNYYSSFLWLVLLYSKRVQCRKRICFVLNWFFSLNVFFCAAASHILICWTERRKKKLETHKNCIDLIWVNVVAVCTIHCACATKLPGTCPAPTYDSVCVYIHYLKAKENVEHTSGVSIGFLWSKSVVVWIVIWN